MTACTIPFAESTHQSWEFETPVPCGVVVGVDGSRESIAAFNAAVTITKARRCALHVVSVIPPFPSYHIDPGIDESKANIDQLRIQMRESILRDAMRGAEADSRATFEVIIGSPAHELVKAAELRAADLILVGRREHGVMDRIMGGETTLQVMRLSSIAVLAVPADLDGPRTIVVATDFSAASLRAATAAVALLGKTGTIYLAHVEPPVELLPQGFVLGGQGAYSGGVRASFQKFIDALDIPGDVVVETVVLNGRPVPSILEFSERVGADVIAAGSHGHSRLERLMLGSVSTGLVRNAACPVVVVPEGA